MFQHLDGVGVGGTLFSQPLVRCNIIHPVNLNYYYLSITYYIVHCNVYIIYVIGLYL